MMLLLVSVFTLSAEEQWYNSQSYAYKYKTNYGSWSSWSDWQTCNLNIKFDLNSDWIIIYSNKTQYYKVIQFRGQRTELDGSQQAYFIANDANGGRVQIRLRMETNGNSQIYVEYSDAMWVYNVVRTY